MKRSGKQPVFFVYLLVLKSRGAWQQSIIGSVSALEKKLCRAVGRSTFHFILLKYFITQKWLFSQKFPLIQNSFVAIHNKMFRTGAKTLVGSGNLKHISGLDMHWYWRTRQAFPFKRKLYLASHHNFVSWIIYILWKDHTKWKASENVDAIHASKEQDIISFEVCWLSLRSFFKMKGILYCHFLKYNMQADAHLQ